MTRRYGIRAAGRIWANDRGSTTVASALIIATVVVLCLVVLLAGTNLVNHRRAGVAADLSAVAGALALQRGDPACTNAQHIARTNNAEITSCEEDGEDVQVVVERLGRTATARAGPAES